MRTVVFIAIAILAAIPVAQAKKVEATVTRADCANVVQHQPAADVAYQPGVDVNGDSVAPADLNGGFKVAVPETISIPIVIDLAEKYGTAKPKGPVMGETSFGKVVWRDGKAWYNGQPLHDKSEADLVAACRNILRRKG